MTLSLQVQTITPDLVSAAGRCFPGLASLSLGIRCRRIRSAQLPKPSQLRALRHLVVRGVARDAQAALWASVAPYMRQLESLYIDEQESPAWGRAPKWASLFTDKTSTTTLTRLTVQVDLEKWLVRLLQQHAPCLQQLAVSNVYSDVHGGRGGEDSQCEPVCSWTVLQTGTLGLSALEWLPLPAEGKLVIRARPTDDRPTLEARLPLSDKVSRKTPALSKAINQPLNMLRCFRCLPAPGPCLIVLLWTFKRVYSTSCTLLLECVLRLLGRR